ncbi:HAD family hydrolase [Pleomorphomonas diazotrophica]|uniref:HAD family hydrolase n=1 Tax=Pleomorphomonas diazotrophica TaxID=1166257 RepID=A0A1I4QRH0_9HYPH|nr:HAD family hydrolase [Pleomorphomonas diazotrophica]PKR90475.1 HAD family hydrolase [Pleomorphomonas diazotrophica]SFM42631.1 putative hydrolase of the HAD superfamily [Pleomorphomonas diazotrophica]
MVQAAVTTLGFDADDTLWQNEQFFRYTEGRFLDLLTDFGDRATLSSRLFAVEKRNIPVYGFGIKGFVLSMMETALEVSDGRLDQSVISGILAMGREMLGHPVELLPEVRETLEALADRYPLVLITKGDLFDQERKLTASGLADLFHAVEIVSEKSASTYARVFAARGDGADKGLMVGNSLRSDILPALEAGAYAVHIPHDLTWTYEHVDETVEHPRLFIEQNIRKVVDVVEKINGNCA